MVVEVSVAVEVEECELLVELVSWLVEKKGLGRGYRFVYLFALLLC